MASTDRDVLLVLHRSTGGASWTNNANWDTDAPIGDWHGVKVKDDGHVVKLDLASNNLRGDIPAILGKLKLLKTLILSDNTLTAKPGGAQPQLLWSALETRTSKGSIPPELGEMESLEVLDLGSNELSGHIPDRLGQLGVSIRTNVEENFTDAGNRSGHQTFVPDLYAEGIGSDPEDERDHWSSEPLEPLHELRYVSFLWRDQGWGNRKGTLFLSLDPGSTDQQCSTQEPKEHRQLMPDPAEHKWTHEVMEIDPKDPLRRLACAGDRYRLSFIAGGGGGHILQARRFTLHFSVAGGSCGDELYSRVLWKIDLSNNQLTGNIPQDLSNLRDLGVLRLGSNGLSGTVPSALVRLERLFDVDLTNNELSVLPMDLTAKWALAVQDDNRKVGVSVNGNPWVRPPRAFLARGLVSAGRWWDGIARFGEGTSSKLKMVLVGLAEAGKTTIVRHFTGGDPADKRTIGVELSEWKPNKNLPLAVSLWDFSGQSDYHASHQIFLTEGALFLLVVDLFELGRDEKSAGIPDPRGAIYRWLVILHERVPGAVVALVGTHGDKFFPRPPPSSESAGDEDRENRIDVLNTLLKILAGLLRQERAKLGGQLSADKHLGNLLQLVRTQVEPRLSADDLGNLVELLRTQLEDHVWADEGLDDLMRLVQTTLVGQHSDEKSKFEDLVQLAQTRLEGQLSADDLCDVLQWVQTRNQLEGRLSAEGLGDLVQLVRTNLQGQLSAEDLGNLVQRVRVQLERQLSAGGLAYGLVELVHSNMVGQLSADDLDDVLQWLRAQLEGHLSAEGLGDVVQLVRTELEGHLSLEGLENLAVRVRINLEGQLSAGGLADGLMELFASKMVIQLPADDLGDVLQWLRARLEGHLSGEGLGDVLQLVRTELEGQLSAECLRDLVQLVRTNLEGHLSAEDRADSLVELVRSKLVIQLSADDLDDVLQWLRARLEGHLSAEGLGDLVQLVRTELEGRLSPEGIGNLVLLVRTKLEGHLSDADRADGLEELVHSKMEFQLSADDLDNALQWLRARLEGHLSGEGLGDVVQLVRTELEGQLSAAGLGDLVQRVRTCLEGQLSAGDLADVLVELVHSKLVGQLSVDDLDDVLRWLRARLEGHLSGEGLGDIVQLVQTELEGQLSAEGIGNLAQQVRKNLEGHLSDVDLAGGLVELVHSKLVGQLAADDLDDVLQWLRARLEGHLSAEGLGDLVQLVRTKLEGQLSAEGLGDLVQLVRTNLEGQLSGTDLADGLLQLVHSKLVCQLSVEGLHYMVQFVRTKLEDQRRAEDLDDLVRLVRTRLQGQLSAEDLDNLLQLLRTQLEGQILGDEELDKLLQLERKTLVGQFSAEDINKLEQLVRTRLQLSGDEEPDHLLELVRTTLEDQVVSAEDLDDLVQLMRIYLQDQLPAEDLNDLVQVLRTEMEGRIPGPRYAEEIKNGQRQLYKAEKRFRTLVRQYQEDKAKELKLSCGNASAEKDDSFQRGSTHPLILHPRVFCASLGLDNRIGRLSDWIIGVAPEKISFSFPAVATILPAAWVDAIAAVEALHKEKGTPYVLWGDAVRAFQRYFQEKHKEEGKEERNKPLSDEDAATNLKEAMKHREAEGGVILSLRDESSPAQSDMIHVDPRWLIELVRRVTDHNLVDKKKQNKILQELLEYDRTRPDTLSGYKNLCETHACFIRQGRLNRDYLRFLWVHRKLEVEGDYAGAQLDKDAFDSMVDTMIKYLFIYPSHGECSNAEDCHIVPARLPEHGNDNILEESIGLGEVVVGKTAWFLRSHAPTGIIGRFLAFTSSRFEASGKCWQHGAHIQWKKDSNEHDVLLCETTIEKDIIPGQSTFPAIAICVKGKTAEAKGVLREVGEQLLSLLQDNIHGYPGLRLPIFEELNITQSDQFQVHFERYLATQLAKILEDTRRESVRMFRAAFPSYGDPVELPYPRLVLLKPVETTSIQETQAEESVNGAIQLRRTWDRWIDLCRSGGSCDFVLVFLCERDFSEIPCGPQGKGFRVHNPGSLFNTLKPLLQGALWLVKIAVGTVASVDLPLHDVLEAFLHATAAEVLEAAPSQFSPSATLDEGQQEGFKELHGPAYKALCDFMTKEEFGPEEARCESCLPWYRPRVHEPIPSEFDWRSHMEMIKNGIGYSWVRKSSEQ
ncbi:LRR-GTPase of the ROCO family [Ectocarpus siliculosus]|uniref:LRR-GTPase of the ROCO family n=1 Tax=Ectocarpus siliculosus TaxID=2880 RepID=D8LK68_ECTSI|nr:LRR-GTPase of the ROCO family [Ectocarpus siliculosus]|eukprot:CBN76032.1 LRR-GTPase of the ROCO family [Ectocarpus siliculosus]